MKQLFLFRMSVQATILMFLLFIKYTAHQSVNYNDATKIKLPNILKPKIVKGEPAKLGEIPYQVAFKTQRVQTPRVFFTFCGGTILKKKLVLSAAHCFIPVKLAFFKYCTGRLDRKHYKSTFAVAGNLNNVVPYKKLRLEGQWKRIGLINFPLSYRFPKDDIALVHLTSEYDFNENVAAIPYAIKFRDYKGLKCLASGYGLTGPKSTTQSLQKAFLQIMTISECNSIFAERMNKFVCTTDRVTDVAPGDSGGPLVCYDTGDPSETDKGILVGIVSGGKPTSGSIFTRVSSFQKYIQRSNAELSKPTFKLNCLLLNMWILMLR